MKNALMDTTKMMPQILKCELQYAGMGLKLEQKSETMAILQMVMGEKVIDHRLKLAGCVY